MQQLIDRLKAIKQVNALNGWIMIERQTGGTYLLKSQTMDPEEDMKLTEQEIELRYEDMESLRDMVWDTMRRQGRGFDFCVDDILKIEEVRHKGRYSVSGYKEEIEWTIQLLQRHLKRIDDWKETSEGNRNAYGKLDEFLSQLQEE